METMNMSVWESTAHELWEIKEKIRELSEKESLLAAQLKQLSDNKTHSDGRFAYIMQIRRGSIEYSSIPMLQGINLEIYRKKDSVVWKLERIK